MDNLEKKVSENTPGFFSYMFSLDEDNKNTLLNIGQYSLLAVLPVIALNKTSHNLFPEADEEKSSFLVLFEIVSQVLVVLAGIFFINRFALYFSPFSKKDYEPINIFNIIVLFLIIIFSFQTKVGEKVNILYERTMDYWDGNKKEDKEKPNVKVSQPISNNQAPQGIPVLGNAPNLLPQQASTSNPMIQHNTAQQPNQGFQGMEGMQMMQEPMAANEGFGPFSQFN